MSSKVWFLGGFFILAATALLVACQPVKVLNGVTPRGAFTLESDVPYGTEHRQGMDIYLPRNRPYRRAVLVFVYGGSWESGDKEDFLFVGQTFARMGYVTVIPNYRLYPEVEFPDFVDDIALAIARLSAEMPESCPEGLDVILMGHSAGGHTAAMLATDPKYLARNQGEEVQVRGLIGLAAPYDLPLDHELVVDKFTRVTDDAEVNPLALATAEAPPSLLLHGGADTTAYPYHTERFTARLEELGVPVTSHIYPRARHVNLLAGVASVLRFLNPATDDIETFLKAHGLSDTCPY
ncbi:alpha/beta hydrolase [Marinimicrobium sp. ABcell2]|uniref:alpha/beta hydrolase n=1 Tax=Marinimicrobium sp. ABcell2 TaxID=3069751 RepID=UPI0027B26979|nr:alpha/beta hydrolase [Marinimicrobium sp. ABcell2]MDQ2075995.1 alpha/beta hydrolase [Marinimicrobium sp. ABcell2]